MACCLAECRAAMKNRYNLLRGDTTLAEVCGLRVKPTGPQAGLTRLRKHSAVLQHRAASRQENTLPTADFSSPARLTRKMPRPNNLDSPANPPGGEPLMKSGYNLSYGETTPC